MANKVYAVVLTNKQTGIFNTWPEAQSFIKTCPSNAKYKGCSDNAAAQAYIDEIQGREVHIDDTTLAKSENSETACVAYVDGSFNATTNTWGYGVVMYKTNSPEDKTELNGSGTAYADSRNVTGEVYGAMVAVREAVKAGLTSITIYHDYAGIADWVTGAWQAKAEMSQKYRDYMFRMQSRIAIKFSKVEGHTGVELNERCDVLAKQACGVI